MYFIVKANGVILAKAEQLSLWGRPDVLAPGSRGGKFHRTKKSGKVRYGPEPKPEPFVDPGEPTPHTRDDGRDHYREGLAAGAAGKPDWDAADRGPKGMQEFLRGFREAKAARKQEAAKPATTSHFEPFQTALRAWRAMGEQHAAAREQLQAEFDQARLAAYQQKFPKRKLPTYEYEGETRTNWTKITVGLGTADEALHAAFTKRAEAMVDEQGAASKAAKERLAKLAEAVVLKPQPGQDTVAYSVRGYHYSTQDYGANSYARNDADLRADEFRAVAPDLDVQVKLKPREPVPDRHAGPFPSTPPFEDYEVHVNLDDEHAEALRMKPGLPLREVVKRMWKRGINPRVSMPFLPPDYEDKVGIDYQGNDKEIAKAVLEPGKKGGKFRLSKRGEVTYHQPGAVSAPYCCLEGCPEPARNGPLCEYHRKKHAMRAGPQGGLGAEGERRVYEREHQFAKGAADIQNPGARGGKFYFDKHGMVKYGDRPMGRMAAKPKPVTGPRRRAAPEPEPKRREAKPERPGQHMAAMSSGGWKQDGRDAEKPGREAPKAKPDRAAAAGPERDPKTPPPPGKFYAPDPSKGVSRVGVPASHLPPPPPIPRLPNLAPDERRAESAFADWFQANPDAAAHIFLTKVRGGEFGATNVFGTDDAKVLSGDYNPEGVDDETAKRARALYNTATHQTANAIAKRAFVMALDDLAQLPDGDPKRHVLATAGGVGAGKGFALKNIQATKEIKERVGAVWDSAGEQNSTEMAWVHDECKKRGLAFTAVFVHAEPLSIWTNPERGVVQRAKNEGRMVDARLFADSYAHGARIFQEWAQQAKDAAVYYLDNSGGPPKQLDDLPGEALAFDADKLYGACVEHLRKAAPGGAILRGGLAGLRIWGAAK